MQEIKKTLEEVKMLTKINGNRTVILAKIALLEEQLKIVEKSIKFIDIEAVVVA